MRNNTVHRAIRRTAALALAIILAIPTVYAAAGEQKLQTESELTEGLTYRNTITVNRDSRVESFSLELEEDSAVYPILLQASGTIYGAATINKAVSYAQERGYHVLGAVNTDFFSLSSGVPIGIVIEDGVYQSSPENESAMLITDGRVTYAEKPEVALTLTNQRTGAQLSPQHLNKLRHESGGLYLLNEDFSTVSTRTTAPGWYVRMKLTEAAELTVNSELTLEVTETLQTSESTSIGPDEYILTAADASGYLEVFQDFQVGDRITLTTACPDEALSGAQWAGGVGDLMVKDGALTDSSQWTYVKDGRAPRTALGVKEDGTLVVYAVDGRQSGYSMGLSQTDLAEELRDQGCVWAVNLDGGGSTAISVRVPGQTGALMQGSPSDGKPRSCATYLLLVTDQKGDGRPERLAMKESGLTVLAGSSVTLPQTVVLDNGLNVLDKPLEDLSVTAREKLGQLENGVYTAGSKAGTEYLKLKSGKLGAEGTAQLHVVDSLTDLTVSRAGSSAALTALSVKPGETVQLAVTGSYWNRLALRDLAPVVWTVTGGIGSVDENGLFTASEQGGSGTVTAAAGGLTRTIQVSMTNVHNDVAEGHWAYDAVEYCYTHGIVGGVSATEFGRDAQIRRADFMLMLYGAVGRPAPSMSCSFADVNAADYYYTALSWAQGAGLASGTGDGSYSPNAPITREQAFTILRQAMPLLGKECPTGSLTVLEQFADRDQIADYARGHVATLVSQGVVSGKGAGIDPRGQLTRAEMAALLYKIITYTPITEAPVDPTEPVDPADPVAPELPDPDQYTLTLDQNEVTLRSGGSVSLSAALTPEFEGAEIRWSSSDPAAAAVTANGVVTNLFPGKEGKAVTITAVWNGVSARCTVYCEAAKLTGTVINAERGLNVRSGPGTDSAIIGGLTNNAQVVVLGVENGWCHILYRDKAGQAAIGYVSGDYISLHQ